MKIVILIDNCPSSDNPCLNSEHGLSVYTDCEDVRFLCDMGLSGAYRENAKRMGVDLSAIDFAFISHGHNDHTGGLGDFLQYIADVPVYLSGDVIKYRYYSMRQSSRRDISTQRELDAEYGNRLRFIDGSRWIKDSIAIVKCECNRFSAPQGNRFLMKDDAVDDFSHELSIAIKTDKGLVIISSCSHCGAMNIIESCKEFTREDKVMAFIGGLHFVDGEWTDEEVTRFVDDIRKYTPETMYYVGHCTGEKSKQILSHLSNIVIFHTAQQIII